MPYIEFRNITKTFGSFTACRNVSIIIEKAHVHSIVGENGAGKSTLMKMLGGVEDITSGEIFLNGQNYRPESAQDAFKNKIAFIHQHFVLADQLTALDNLILSFSSNRMSLSIKNAAEVKTKAETLLRKFKWQISLNSVVHDLSVGEQQRLEILKALMQEPDIIIFDEPTAVLTPQESEDLMAFIRQLKFEGKTIILISHKLNEIKFISDEVSVLRHGQLIETRPILDFSVEQMAELMIGRRVVKNNQVERSSKSNELFQIPKTDITLKKSEIFGVAGIEGNGQNQLIATILNEFKSKNLSYGDITEDRLKLSVFEDMDLCEHMLLKHHDRFVKGGIIQKTPLEDATEQIVKEWDVRPPEISKPLSEFSGGNQQKFMVGREIWNNPDVLLAAHPTRGVDLGAQEKIHNSLLDYSKNEKTVFLISSDLNEILFLSDRYIILNKNKIYGPFTKTQLTELQMGLIMAANDNNAQHEAHLAGEV
ncbi:MAG: ABC transporter ATP-binding protein [Pseudobdellovibrio sp.]